MSEALQIYTPTGVATIVVVPQPLCADDVRAARLDMDARGRVFDEIRLATALQVLRSIRDEQPGASAPVRALCAATLERIGQ